MTPLSWKLLAAAVLLTAFAFAITYLMKRRHDVKWQELVVFAVGATAGAFDFAAILTIFQEQLR